MVEGPPAVMLKPTLCGVNNVVVGTVPPVLVRVNRAEVPTALAVTEYPPAMSFAVNAGAAARPEASVVAVIVLLPLHVPLAPVRGAVNVTVAPGTGEFPFISVACSGVPKLL